MTAHDDLDRQLNDFLRDGPTELPYESFDAVRDRTEQTRQRVVIGPWRLPEMNKFVTIGLGAAAVVVVSLRRRSALRFAERWIGLAADRHRSRPPARADRQPRTIPVAARIRPAADPELHLDAARDFRVVPRGMDRSSGDRALDG